MNNHPVTLNLPDEIYDPIRQIAEAREQSIQEIVIDQLRSVLAIPLPTLPDDEIRELVAFKFLSDDTLRSIAREQMAAADQVQMQMLMDKNSLGTISNDEYATLAQFVERGQRLTLRKAWAAGILMERGYQNSSWNTE